MKVTGETVTDSSLAYPTAANQVGRIALSVRNTDDKDPIFVVNSVGISEATADPDTWEIGAGESFNTDFDDTNKIILVAKAGKTVDISILEIKK